MTLKIHKVTMHRTRGLQKCCKRLADSRRLCNRSGQKVTPTAHVSSFNSFRLVPHEPLYRQFSTSHQHSAILPTETSVDSTAQSENNAPANTHKNADATSEVSTAYAIKHITAKLSQKKTLPTTLAPYATYGTTEGMFKMCASAGDYTSKPPTSFSTSSSASSSTSPSTESSVKTDSVLPQDNPSPTPQHLKTSTGEDICYPLDQSPTESWHARYNLAPTFSTWAQLTILHLWLLQVRIRALDATSASTTLSSTPNISQSTDPRLLTQNLLDHFFYASETRMDLVHGLSQRGVRTKYLKDMFDQYRGAVLSYDQGLVEGDAVLAAAIWRNVFKGRQDVDCVGLAEIVGWCRMRIDWLGRMGDEDFIRGGFGLGKPWRDAGRIVQAGSKGIGEGFE